VSVSSASSRRDRAEDAVADVRSGSIEGEVKSDCDSGD
jgi:hypothetical protein